jgi:hypothetical protein
MKSVRVVIINLPEAEKIRVTLEFRFKQVLPYDRSVEILNFTVPRTKYNFIFLIIIPDLLQLLRCLRSLQS